MSDEEFTESQAPDPYVGTTVQGRYRFVRKLGEGGMGAVYEGENIAIKRKVAIKCLHAHLARNASVIYRFRNEALAATQIGHEHIVDVLDMGQLPDGAYFLVLEYLDGTDLAKLLDERGVLPLGRACRITAQVLDALGAAHSAGIVHRDIKPENVFLVKRSSGEDFVKLLDFGIAKVAGDEPSMRTATGTQLGTPYFMPPEQALGQKDLDARADLYATAVMLYHALSGRFPFEGTSLPMLMYNICHTEAQSLLSLRPELPAALSLAVMQALSKDREQRPRTAAEFRAKLEPYLSSDLMPTASYLAQLEGSANDAATPTPVNTTSPNAPSKTAPTTGRSTTLSASAVPVAPAAVTSKSKATAIVGVVAMTTLAIVGGAAMLMRGSSRASEAPTTARAAVATTTQPDSATAPATPAAPAAHRVRVEIDTVPPGATLVLDGRPLNNPYDGDLAVSDEPHRLEISAPGFLTEQREVSLIEPQRIHVRLERGTGRVVVASDGRRTRDNAAAVTPVAPTAAQPAVQPTTQSAAPTGASEPRVSPVTPPATPPAEPRANPTPAPEPRANPTPPANGGATPNGLREMQI
jgi:serine/threonine protein kinase